MTEFTNPITRSNLIDRFYSFARATANSSIVYGTNAYPWTSPEPTVVSWFGGGTSGTSDTTSLPEGEITASTIYNNLLAATATYTNIRNARFQRFTTRSGFSNNTDLTTNDVSGKAHLATVYRQSISSSDVEDAGVTSGSKVEKTKLDSLFTNLRTAYTTKRDTQQSFSIRVCHSSCHNSCHNSRIRR